MLMIQLSRCSHPHVERDANVHDLMVNGCMEQLQDASYDEAVRFC